MTNTLTGPSPAPDAVTPAPAVRVDGVVMRYGPRTVLDGVGFEIEAGQRVAVLGPNGAGKSTLIEIMEGLRKQSAGTVEVLDTNPATAPEAWRSRLGVVLQAWRDHGSWRVSDFLDYVAAAHRSAGLTDLWPVDELLEAVDLGGSGCQRMSQLSGGQRRRVDVAAALISRPELLFLDEPTTGFDPEVRRSFYSLIRNLADGTTIIWATHNLHEAEEMCDRIIILTQGRIAADGSPSELQARLSARSTVSWTASDGHHTEVVDDSDALVRELVAGVEPFWDLEVSRGSLEQAYLAIVEESDEQRGVQ